MNTHARTHKRTHARAHTHTQTHLSIGPTFAALSALHCIVEHMTIQVYIVHAMWRCIQHEKLSRVYSCVVCYL